MIAGHASASWTASQTTTRDPAAEAIVIAGHASASWTASQTTTRDPAAEAIVIAGPSNMAVFGALAAAQVPDLHLMGPGQQTRALPRGRPAPN